MSIWDDPEIRSGGDYVKFENPGDNVNGTITFIGKHNFEDGKVAAKLIIATAEGDKTLTAGQVQLASKLGEARPEVGDHVDITYVRSEKRAGGKTLKHFAVEVKKGAPKSADDF
jgi:uncharacterized protein YhfF